MLNRILRARLFPYVVSAVVLISVVWAVAYRTVVVEQQQNFERSAEQAEQLAQVFEQQTLRIFHYSDTYLKAARREFTENGGLDAVRRMIEAIPLDRSIVSHITIIDQDGKPLLVSGHEIKPGTTAKDRDYFKLQKEAIGDQTLVSLPKKGRNSGKLLIRLVRRIDLPDGRFGGVIFAALEVVKITEFFAALKLGPRSSATLVGTDKRIRARSSYGRLGPGQDISGSRIWRELEQSPVGLYKQHSVVDQITRYYAYRKLSAFPLIVAIGISTEDLSEAAARFKLPAFAIAVLTTIIIVIMTVLIWREMSISRKLRESEADLRENRDQLRLITDNLPVLIVYIDAEEHFRFVNQTCADWYACPVEEVLGRSVQEMHHDQYKKFQTHIAAALNGEAPVFEHRVDYPDGVTRDVRSSYIPHMASGGQAQGFFALTEDISDVIQAEERLRQAQKMEAVGQLTGGVAHDFNNLLAVIQGNADLLEKGMGDSKRLAGAILRASERGAGLTQRLLAFSRKQSLFPRSIDLAELAKGMSELLARTLGETIQIVVVSTPDPWPAMADPGQVENALLNLALNARDAMPKGGKLTIDCANVRLDEAYVAQEPEADVGDYAVLTVSDSGAGMTADVLEHAVEPFFTTKDVGGGSGLGLPMVYGFAKQSGGHMTISSQEGQGTVVRLYLPRSDTAAERETMAPDGGEPRGRGELVLVIEDDPDVRALAVKTLDSLGYRTLEAGEAGYARAVLGGAERIDLVLSDVVLPGGVSGPEFAREARSLYPDLKLLFMSGYPAEAASRSGLQMQDTVLLNKPFQRRELAAALRTVLDG